MLDKPLVSILRRLCLALTLYVGAPVMAQTAVEVGGSVGVAAAGSEGALAVWRDSVPSWAVYAGGWFGNRIQLNARVARLPFPDLSRQRRVVSPPSPEFPENIDQYSLDRSRTFLSGQLVYHFRRGHPVRPVLGVSLGVFRGAGRTACTPPGCEPLIPGGIGKRSSYTRDLGFIFGVAGLVRERIVLRGVTHWHNFGGEESSTTEIIFEVGYRFPLGGDASSKPETQHR